MTMEATPVLSPQLLLEDEDNDLLHFVLLKVYYLSLAVVWFYSLSRWKNLLTATWLYAKGEGNAKNSSQQQPADANTQEGSDDAFCPAVTVQIVSYNEGEVLPTTLQHVCALDWPSDKLFVHVLDDSTDASSKAKVIDACTTQQQLSGVHVEYKTRPDRRGFKAGNLAYHFDAIATEYVLYLDGDHQVQPDLLRRTIPLFQDQPQLGLVQAGWGYYNTHTNLLTECDALGLDIHHTVEQPARSYLHRAFGFNGTGGIWRRQAILDASGWTSDTVTEDLSISYLAHLQGYYFQYVADCPQKLELPVGILAHIQQKQRWTKGFLQVFRLYYWKIFRSRTIAWHVKLEAFWHFTGPIQLVAAAVGILIYPHLVFHGIHTRWLEALSSFPLLEPLSSALHAIFTKTPASASDYAAGHTRASRLCMILPYFALRFGMAPFEAKAVCEGLFSNDATFHSTPKDGTFDTSTKGYSFQKKHSAPQVSSNTSKIKRHWSDDMVAYAALVVALHQLLYILIFDIHTLGDNSRYFDVGVRILNVLICVGLLAVAGSFLLAKHLEVRAKLCQLLSRTVPSPRKLYPLVLAFICLDGIYVCLLHSGVLMDDNFGRGLGSAFPPIALDGNSSRDSLASSFVCLPSGKNQKPLQMSPLVVFAEPRTGSNLLFDMFTKRSAQDVEIWPLYELFANYDHEDWRHVEFARQKLSKTCGSISNSTTMDSQPRSETTAAAFEGIKELLRNKRSEPQALLHGLGRVPSVATDRAYFAFKVFASHFQTHTFDGDVAKLIRMVRETANHQPKFIVLWRRRMIESFVSFQLAMITQQWTSGNQASALAPTNIKIDKAQLVAYVNRQRTYYKAVKEALQAEGITNYLVLEYGRDLLHELDQLTTVQTLERELLNSSAPSLAEETMARLSRKKQQVQDLSTLVENWEDVEDWGYGGDLEDWEDLFA